MKHVNWKFKDETHSLPTTEFVALNPNCCSFNHLTNDEVIENTKKSKRASKDVLTYENTQADYTNAMRTNEQWSRNVVSLIFQNHNMIRTIKNQNIA